MDHQQAERDLLVDEGQTPPHQRDYGYFVVQMGWTTYTPKSLAFKQFMFQRLHRIELYPTRGRVARKGNQSAMFNSQQSMVNELLSH